MDNSCFLQKWPLNPLSLVLECVHIWTEDQYECILISLNIAIFFISFHCLKMKIERSLSPLSYLSAKNEVEYQVAKHLIDVEIDFEILQVS